MAKLSIFFLLCYLSMALGNYFYYQGVPAVSGAMSYPYVGYPYAVVAPQPDCDKKEKGGESSSSESSSEESSSSESSEEGEKKEEKEGGEEKKEEGEEKKEGGEEKKEGEEKEESSSSSSSSSSEESKEGEGEKKEEKKKGKEEKSLFPPRVYSFPPVQQVVYAQPAYSYVQQPYKTYSVVRSPVTYPVKSAYVASPYAAATVKNYGSPVARIMSVPGKGYSAYSGYLSPATGVYGLSPYVGNNVAYLKA